MVIGCWRAPDTPTLPASATQYVMSHRLLEPPRGRDARANATIRELCDDCHSQSDGIGQRVAVCVVHPQHTDGGAMGWCSRVVSIAVVCWALVVV